MLALLSTGCASADPTNFGPPGGLAGKKLPLPASNPASLVDAGAEGAPATDDAGTSGDATMTVSTCSASWGRDIFPNMMTTGPWRCADSSCHGGLQSPKMSADPTATYSSLAAYTLALAPHKLPYIRPGSMDPAASGIECNLSGTSCGNQMPLTTTGARLPTAQDVQTVDTWVRCGAPDN